MKPQAARPPRKSSSSKAPARAHGSRRAPAAAAGRPARAERRLAAWRRWLRWPRISRLLRRLLAAVLGAGALVWAAGPVYAQVAPGQLPTGGTVVTGQGHLQFGANALTIHQSSARLGIDWSSFSIGRDALVEFLQPGPASIALNRVVGHEATQIYGRLRANGQVFLTNPNGVLFAPGAKVDVGGLVASTLDMTQADFAAGRDRFSAVAGSTGAVVNEGELVARAGGYLALFGQTVDNRGDLRVDTGSVVLASGRAATVSISGAGLISAVVEPGLAGAVLNSGRIAADGGSVTLSASSAEALASSLVNNSGIVRANTIEQRGGEIWITGDRVVHSGHLQADAAAGGDAGRITVKGDMKAGTLDFTGTASAKAVSGQGGEIETSAAKVQIDGSVRVDTRGTGGRHGQWLIDPTNFTVADGSGPSTSSGIGANTLSANLDLGNVTLATAADGTEAGDLFVNAAVSWSADTRLTLTAHRHVEINAPITATGDAAGLSVNPGTGGNFTLSSTARVRLPGANSGFSLGGTAYTMVRNLAGLRALDGSSTVLSGRYALADDLDASETATVAFNPIGNETTASTAATHSFSGQFQGLGNTISGLVVDQPTTNVTGLFAQVNNARIENLRLAGGRVNGSQYAGAVAGIIAGSTTVVNVHSDLPVTAVDDSSGGVFAGGLFGSSPPSAVTTVSISRSSASGAVSVDTNTATARAGGLVGQLSRGTMTDVSASGNVSATLRTGTNDSTFYVGGLAGNSSGSITRGVATGNVTGGHESGGLVGRFEAFNATISDSRAEGDVTGSGQTGGLVGYTTVATGSTGSLSGIVSSQALGNVTATGYLANDGLAGGAVGHYNLATSPVGLSASGNVTATRAAGGVIGFLESTSVALAAGSVVSVVPTGTTKSISAQYWAGGLVGYSSSTGAFDGLTFTGDVAVTTALADGAAGGLVGRSNGPVRNSSSAGTVSSARNAGGLVGIADGAGGFTTVSSSATVTSSGTLGNVGGLVGEYANTGNLVTGSASGVVSGGNVTGGLVGNITSAASLSAVSQTGATVTGTEWVGGLVGYGRAGSITNATAVADVVSTSTGTRYAGGLAGRTGGAVSDASATGDVTTAATTGTAHVGGLIGRAEGSGALITDVTASGDVTAGTTGASGTAGGLIGWATQGDITLATASGGASGGLYAGGLVGYFNPTAGSIRDSSASGNVSSRGDAGGLVGYAAGTGTIADSSASGSVSSTATSTYSAGGAIGYSGMTLGVSNVSATGTPTGGAQLGGVIGAHANGTVSGISTTITALSGTGWVGGLVGSSTSSTLSGLVSAVNVTHTGSSGGAGGIVGTLTGALQSSSASGNIVSGSNAGGLAAHIGSGGSVANSSATGNVSSSGAESGGHYVGGAVGHYASNVAPVAMRASGDVSGGNTTGGLIGYLQASTMALGDGSLISVVPTGGSRTVTGPRWVGGLIGYSDTTGAVSNLSFAGSVTATGSVGAVGGLIGRSGGPVNSSSTSGSVTGAGDTGGLVGQAAGAGGFTNVSSSATVTGAAALGDVGGLVGQYANSGPMATASSSAAVSGGVNTGGLVGYYNSAGALSAGSQTGATVTGSAVVGGLVGYADAAPMSAVTAVADVTSTGNATRYVGGLVGRTAGTITNATASGAVSATGTGGLAYVGGVIGLADGAGGVTDGSATGSVSNASLTSSTATGGLIGYASNGNVTRGSATGSVTGGLYTGGLVGYYSPSTGTISASTASGNVSGRGDVGGLVGFANGTGAINTSGATGSVSSSATVTYSAGGAIGYTAMSGGVANVTAAGTVSGGAQAGGVIGYHDTTAAHTAISTTGAGVTGVTWVGGLVGYSRAASSTGLTATIEVTHTGTSGAAGGLFGFSNGAVASSSATGAVTSGAAAGGLIGRADGTGAKTGLVAGGRITSTTTTSYGVGGLIGEHNGGELTASDATGNVSGGYYVGGLTGYSSANANIDDVSATGSVTSTFAIQAGGLIGSASGTGSLSNAMASGTVSSGEGGAQVGGLVGRFSKPGGMSTVSATGNVSGGNRTGGLVGYFVNAGSLIGATAGGTVTGSTYVGGLVGDFVSSGDLTNATATGAASGTTYVGGLVGSFYDAGSSLNLRAEGAVTADTYGGGLFGIWQYSGGLTDSVATGNVSTAGLAGGLVGYSYDNDPGIVNSRASGSVRGASYVGGLVGQTQFTSIDRSTATGAVTAINTTFGSTNVGGLVGSFYQPDVGGGLRDSSASGSVTVDARIATVGGLAGEAFGGSLQRNSASGAVVALDSGNATSTSLVAGGLVGSFQARTGDRFNDNSATGNVTAAGPAGGLVGEFAGRQMTTAVSNVSATGNVVGRSSVGGLIGSFSSANLENGRATGHVTNLVDFGSTGGLIGLVQAYYSNTIISNSLAEGLVSGGDDAGGLVGRMELVSFFSSTVRSAGIIGSQASGAVSNASMAGGLVGQYEGGSGSGSSTLSDLGIRDSRASGTVSGTTAVGGLVGNYAGYGGIRQSLASGSVTVAFAATGDATAGGLVGDYRAFEGEAGTGTIVESTASGNVSLVASSAPGTGDDFYAGGLVGRMTGAAATSVTVSNSYASGDVTFLADGGGRIRAGGLIGSTNSSIERAYSAGRVEATGLVASRRVGGLVGESRVTGTTALASFWATDASGQDTSALGTASTLELMRLPATYDSWDIATGSGSDAVWRIYAGRSLPLLRHFLTPLTLTLADITRTYDGTSGLGTSPITLGGVLVSNPQAISVFSDAINVGAYAITGDNLTSTQAGYDLSITGTATLTITPRPLTLAGVVENKVYDGTTSATLAASPTLGNLVPGEDLVFVPGSGFSAIFATRTAGVDKTVLLGGSYGVADGTVGRASNYELPSGLSTTATITPKPVTVGAITAVNRVYDGTRTVAVNADAGTVDGVIAGDSVAFDPASVTSGTIPDKNVGTRPVTVTGATLTGTDAANYTIEGLDGITVEISRKALTLNGLTAYDRQYNRSTGVSLDTSGATLAGVVPGDLVLPQNSSLSGRVADKNVGVGKPVTVTGAALRGPDAANYTVTPGALTVNITPYQLTVYLAHSGTSSRVYDGTTDASTFWPVYWYSGDDITVNATSIGYADKNVARDSAGEVINKTITATGLTLSGADAANYALQNTTATLTGRITPRTLAVSGVTAVDRVYDGTRDVVVNIGSATVDTSTVVSGDDVSVSTPGGGTVVGQMATKNAGIDKPVTVPGLALTGADAGNYSITSGDAGVTVTIARKDLTATYTGGTKVYDGTAYAPVTAAADGVISGDDVRHYINTTCDYIYYGCAYYTRPGGTPSSYTQDRNAGSDKPIVVVYNELVGTDAANYRLTNTTGIATPGEVTPKPVTLEFNGLSKVYDGSTTANVSLNIGASGLFSADGITATQTAVFTGTGAKNVGSSKPIAISDIVASGTGIGNYTVLNTTATASGAVTPKSVVVSGINATSRPYDGTTTVAVTAGESVGSSGFVDGDTVSVTLPPEGLSTGTIATPGVGTAKPVTVTGLGLGGIDAPNYRIDSSTSGITVDIRPKALTPSYSATPKIYDGGATATVVSNTDGIVSGDTLTFTQLASFTGPGAKNVGTDKPISITDIRLGGASAANYSLATTTATTTGTVEPKTVTPTYAGESRVYSGVADVAAPVRGTSAGFITTDTVSLTQTAVFADGRAGVGKAVSISDITLSGPDAGNYLLAATTAATTATITPRPLSVTGVTATGRVYDGTTTVAVNVSGATVDTSAVVAGDNVSIALPPDGISTGVMADRFVGSAKPVTISGASLTGSESANYVLVGATGLTVNITPRPLTAAYSALDKIYDGSANADVVAVAADLLPVDSGGVSVSASGVFSAGKGVGTDKTVAISGGFLGGPLAGNYLLQNSSGSATADITPRTLSLGFGSISKVYDGLTTVAVNTTLGGRVSGDVVSTTQSAAFTGDGAKNVGTGKPVAVSGITLVGADAANYRLASDSATASGSITPRNITISGLDAVTAVDRVYDGTTTVAVVVPAGVTLVPTSSDIIAGDSVSIAVPASGTTTGTMADKHAGEGKVVTVSGLTLSGTDAANYRITGTAGITVDITPLGLTADWAGVNRIYDGTVAAQASATSASLIGGDSVLIRGNGVFTDGKNVGTAKPVSITSGTLSGSDARNYTLLNPTATTTADVTARSVTVSYGVVDKVYDGSVTAPVAATAAGFIAGDSIGTTQTAVFTGPGAKNVGSDKPVAVSGITLTGADAGNYELASSTASTTGRITPKPITLTGLTGVTATNRAYDGTTSVAVRISGSGPVTVDPAAVVPGDEVSVNPIVGDATTGTMLDKHVGSAKPVVVDGLALTGADAANYRVAATEGVTVNITPRNLTAVYSGVDKVYDGTAAATVTGSSADILGGDTVLIGGSARFSAGKNVGTDLEVLITAGLLTGSDARNYALLNPTGTATADITPRTLVARYSGGSRVYDGTVLAPVNGTLEGLVAGDTVLLSQSAQFTGTGARNAGVGKAVSITGITLTGGDAFNYRLDTDTASTTATVTPRPLRIIGLTGVTAVDRVYDGTREVQVNVSTSGPITPEPGDLIDGDVVTLTAPPTGTTTGLMANKNVGDAKPVAVSGLTIGGADAANYTVAETAGVTVNITPRSLTPTFLGNSRVYDGTVAATVGGSSADILAGDSVLILGSGVFTGEGARNAGLGKTIAVTSALLAGADGGNYALTTTTGTALADITPRLLAPAYTGVNREYDGTTNATVTRSLAGLIAGDSVALSEIANFTDGKNVGTAKPVLVSGISLSGSDAANYRLGSGTATTTADVTPRTLTVTGLSGLTATNRVYDGTLDVAVSFSGAGGSTGATNIVPGDDVSVSFTGGGGARLLDKNAGLAKPVTLSGLTVTGADASNYRVGGVDGLTVDIAQRPVTLAGVAAVDRVYDGTTLVNVNASGATITGAIAGDLLSVAASATGTMADRHVGAAKPVSVAGVALAGADAGNYVVIDSAPITVNITPREISAVLAGVDKVYDGTTAATVRLSATGLIDGDAVSLGATAAFTGPGARNAGADKPVSVTALSLTGADAGNYRLASSSGSTTASILPRPLSAGATVAPRVYDGTTTASVSLVSSGVIDGDAVTLSGTATYTGDGARNVGVDKPVTVAALTLGGADAGNYTLAGVTSLVTTGSITPRPLALTMTVLDKVYDGDTGARVSITGNAIAGDDVLLAGTGAQFAQSDAGSGLRVSVSAVSLAGADRGNYSLPGELPSASGNILRAPLTITAPTLEKLYGNELVPSPTAFSATGLVAGQTVGSVLLASDGFGALQPVGGSPYALVPSSASGGSFNPANYDVRYVSGAVVIRPRPLTVTSDFVLAFEDELAGLRFPATVTGLLSDQGHGLTGLVAPTPSLAGLVGGSSLALRHSGGTVTGTNPANYELRYQAGRLLVLPKPVRLGDDSGGTGDGGFGISSFTPQEVAAARTALDEALRTLVTPPTDGDSAGQGLRLPGVPGTLSAAEIAALFGNDGRQVTLPSLQRLPLISLDPVLRRLLGAITSP
jgi:filamentous hemagglutinin family protein